MINEYRNGEETEKPENAIFSDHLFIDKESKSAKPPIERNRRIWADATFRSHTVRQNSPFNLVAS